MILPFVHPIWSFAALALGACIGSFLNVVIYRVPRGKSVVSPSRSYCPSCGGEIAWYHNLPVISWCLLRGKCAMCGARIGGRYIVVEIVTALLFLAVWHTVPPVGAALCFVFIALLVAIIWIDAELMIIPAVLTNIGIVGGAIAALISPDVLHLGSVAGAPGDWGLTWWGRGLQALAGAAAGFVALKAVVLLGKLLFGRRVMDFPSATAWHLREPEGDEDELTFVIGEGDDREEIGWGEMFYRASDRLELGAGVLVIDGKEVANADVIIRAETIEAGGKTWKIGDISSASGATSAVVIPREAMGDGDPHLLAMIGAWLGMQSLLFVVLASCVTAIVAAIAGRVGLGRPLPYGPFLAIGGLAWMFGGWELWEMYLELVPTR